MTAVLAKHREFEDILGSHGTRFKIPEREYTVLADDMRLFVPTGRAVPAAFNRVDGKLLY